jgi:hypothetical protein
MLKNAVLGAFWKDEVGKMRTRLWRELGLHIKIAKFS